MFGAQKTVSEVLSSRLAQAVLLVVAALTVMTTSTLLSIKTVNVSIDGGKSMAITTIDKTVGQILAHNNIAVGEHDFVSPPLASRLNDNQSITIARAFPIKVNLGNDGVIIETVSKSVAKALAENGIIIGETDIVTPSLDSVVNKGTEISITQVAEDMITVTEDIPFKTVSSPNGSLQRGTTEIKTEGKVGIKEIYYKVVHHNGEEISRELVGERVVQEPVTQVFEYGTSYHGAAPASRGSVERGESRSFSYSAVYTFAASAYDLSYESCGKNPGDRGYGITASGMQAQRGVVAVDPSVIPLGTKLYIESADGYPDYGYAVAGDTGGAIKGYRVDLFMDSHAEAINFGRRNVKVYILN
ncbi:MAG: G5 domain-containing protein [Clostridia bacterium]|nr:G5 domain-containing protein [Clostridia bacterium]